MPQDAFTLRYLCEELNEILKEGKINRITQSTVDVTVFSVYTKSHGVKKLLLDVNPSLPRIGIIDKEPESEIPLNGFCMQLKKHLLSATVKSISLVGFDRIVRIEFVPSSEFFDSSPKTLFIELMGRYSNVILTENGVVLGGNRGINMLDNNVRPLISGKKYVYPPIGDKKLPGDALLKEIFRENKNDLSKTITSCVQGIAESTAKEIEFCYYQRFNDFNEENFFRFLNDYLYNTIPKPCVIYNGAEVKDVFVYPYNDVTGEIKYFDSLCAAENEYFNAKIGVKALKELNVRLFSKTQTAIKKIKKRLSAISSREKEAEEAETNRIKGELILANLYKIEPGDKEIELTNYYDGKAVKVLLDATISPAQNAQNYYKKYSKQKRASVALLHEKTIAESELEYLLGVEDELAIAENISDLKAIEDELVLSGIIKSHNKTVKKKNGALPFRNFTVEGFSVKAGKNNIENDELTFSAKASDIWVHAKDYHSSHVIIKTEGKTVPENVIKIAAEICAYYSKGRDGGKAEIVYAEKRNVKKPPKSRPGFCTYTNFKSMMVFPDAHAELSD